MTVDPCGGDVRGGPGCTCDPPFASPQPSLAEVNSGIRETLHQLARPPAGKTGSGGRPWVTLERPKPPPVADIYEYWGDPPPVLSARCEYWLRQVAAGWAPNRSIGMMGRDESAAWFGVFMWEWANVLWPAIYDAEHAHRMVMSARRGGATSRTPPTPKDTT